MKNEYDWLSPNDDERCKWAHRYLRTQLGLKQYTMGASDYDMCLKILDEQNTDKRKLLLIQMKAAWRQKEYRDAQKRNGYKACSFFLDSRTLKELKRLSKEKNQTSNETLKELIHQTYLANKELKKPSLA